MDTSIKESIRKKTTSIPRLNKKISCESPHAREFQEDTNALNRCSSDPNQHAYRTSDHNISNTLTRTKKLCKFTLNEKFAKGRNQEMVSDNNETEDEMNSCVLNGEDHNRIVSHEEHSEDCEKNIHDDKLSDRYNENCENIQCLTASGGEEILGTSHGIEGNYIIVDEFSHIGGSNTCPELSRSRQKSIPPLQLQNIQNQINEDAVLRNQASSRSSPLQEAYLKHVENDNGQNRIEQCKWNILNPLYKNIPLRKNLPNNMLLNPSLISDIDVKKLTHKEESSEVESDDEAVFKTAKSCNNDKGNSTLSRLYNCLKTETTSSTDKSNKGKGESLVDAFMEVFGDDSHIIQKLRNKQPIKYDDRFRKLKPNSKNKPETKQACVIQESPGDTLNYSSRKLRFVQDLYKNDDVYSSITASSNDRSIPDHSSCQCSPRPASAKSKSIANNMMKGCGCEIKHLQLNDVQKSIQDIHSTMMMMLDNLSPTAREDVAVELMKLRNSYDECLTYQRKIAMQNKKLQSDIHDLCMTMFKILESKNSDSKLKYFVLPMLGVVVYFVINHFELCNKIPVVCDE